MHYEKSEIENYLAGVRKAIIEGNYQIAPREKNKNFMLDYVISEQEELDIINSLTAMDFSEAVHNDHKGREYEILFIFGKNVRLTERFGTKERTVALYIKFNKIENQYLFIISFHKHLKDIIYTIAWCMFGNNNSL